MRNWARPVCLAMAFGGLLALPSVAMAETVTFKAEMLGTNESPANDSTARGLAEATFDTGTKELQYNVIYSGLSGPAMGAHIHGPADAGNNAGILVPFPHTESPITGSAKLNDQQAQELLDGRLYVNIHTKAHPGGEIRGQLIRAK